MTRPNETAAVVVMLLVALFADGLHPVVLFAGIGLAAVLVGWTSLRGRRGA